MAKILISYYSDYGEAMYDAITDVLQKNGNDIFRFNINNPVVSITRWGGKSRVNKVSILDDIAKFNPDIVLNFNNSLPVNCHEILGKNCKICAIDADAPEVAFWNKDIIDKFYDQYIFLGLQSYSKTMYGRYLGKTMTAKNYMYFPPATIVKSEKLRQDKNISFIGSNFYPLKVPEGQDFFEPVALELYDAIKKNYFFTLAETEKLCNGRCASPQWMLENVRSYYCGQERLKYLQQLTDLGFTLYGVRWWNKISYVDFDLAKCFDPTPKVTLEENQWVYNTSKISVNISHPLAKSSFSWRVMDIMASNSCLLMEDKPDWRDLFEKYLSPETLDVVIYKDRFDMRDKARRLLADEKLRKKCVAELNNAIEKNGRWEIRFAALEKFLKVKILNNKNKKQEYIFIQREEKTSVASPAQDTRKLREVSGLKKRYKNIFYLTMLLIGQIPVVDHLICNSKRRLEIIEKLHKWMR